jgi:hypothetical protein
MIQYRSFVHSQSEYLPIFRKLDKNFPTKQYEKDVIIANCHDGQRKLLYSEIEFYTLLSQKYSLDEILVVYVGSGHGVHMSIIFDMFPQLEFILIDKKKSICKHPFMRNKEKVRVLLEYFDDESYKKIIEMNTKKKKIAFMSDIRAETSEEEIWRDMIQQQLWLIQLDSIAYLLKFRLPYAYKNINMKKFNYTLPLNHNQSNHRFLNNKNDKSIIYLKGDIYFQIYTSSKSTETRLIYIRDKDEKFTFDSYNIIKYENQCFYFNQISRKERYTYKDSKEMKHHILGYDDSYESVCEYYIIDQYIEKCSSLFIKNYDQKNPIFSLLHSNNTNSNKTIKLVYHINDNLVHLLNKDLITCILNRSKQEDLHKMINNPKDLLNILTFQIFYYFYTIQSIKIQIQYFIKANLLKKREYMDQLYLLKDIFQNQHLHIKAILKIVENVFMKQKGKNQDFQKMLDIILIVKKDNLEKIESYLFKNTKPISVDFYKDSVYVKQPVIVFTMNMVKKTYLNILYDQIKQFYEELDKIVEIKKSNHPLPSNIVKTKSMKDQKSHLLKISS